MTTNDELARLRAAFAAPAVSAKGAKGAKEAPEACPPSDRIWLAVRGELPPDELRGIVDHIATCSACAEDWRIAMVFEEESRAAPASPIPVREKKTATVRHRAWMAIAASILVAVVGFQLRPQPKGPEQEAVTYRGGDPTGVQSLVEGPLSRDAFVLRWTASPMAESYNLQVSTTGYDSLFQADGLTSTKCRVPAEKLTGMRSGDKVLWAVTPVARGGDLLPLQTFQTSLK
jgi:Putative zinc-finger